MTPESELELATPVDEPDQPGVESVDDASLRPLARALLALAWELREEQT
jgi:hypothetical protein